MTVVEPGFFRSDILDMDKSLMEAPIRIPDYDTTAGDVREFVPALSHNQPGDPAKLARSEWRKRTRSWSVRQRRGVIWRLQRTCDGPRAPGIFFWNLRVRAESVVSHFSSRSMPFLKTSTSGGGSTDQSMVCFPQSGRRPS